MNGLKELLEGDVGLRRGVTFVSRRRRFSRRCRALARLLFGHDQAHPCSHHWVVKRGSGSGAMLVACRLAGLSALEAHYADDNAQAQSGVEEHQGRRRPRPSEVRARARRELQRRHPAACGAGDAGPFSLDDAVSRAARSSTIRSKCLARISISPASIKSLITTVRWLLGFL
jgi:hypothetical protein